LAVVDPLRGEQLATGAAGGARTNSLAEGAARDSDADGGWAASHALQASGRHSASRGVDYVAYEEAKAMYQVSTTDLRCRIGETVSRPEFGRERTIIRRRGKPVAAIVPFEDFETLEALEEQLVDEGLVDEAKERRAARRPGITLDELKARLGL
jgi:prevent-host-death family protein